MQLVTFGRSRVEEKCNGYRYKYNFYSLLLWKPAFIATLEEWLVGSHEIKRRRARLVPGWVNACLTSCAIRQRLHLYIS